MAPRIRLLEPADAPLVLSLARALGEWFNDEGIAAMERDLTGHRGRIMEEEGHVMGFATWRPIDSTAAELSWMGVDRTRHRRGHGSALLKAVISDVRQAGHTSLEVYTVADSCDYEPYERTRRFYRAQGFRDHRIDRGFYGPPEDRYDRLVLKRET